MPAGVRHFNSTSGNSDREVRVVNNVHRKAQEVAAAVAAFWADVVGQEAAMGSSITARQSVLQLMCCGAATAALVCRATTIMKGSQPTGAS